MRRSSSSGARVWKLKRAVRYDYLDFSTAARRRVMCDAEVRINRRSAPTLYRRVVAVTREHDGSLALGALWNGYLSGTADFEGVALLPLFLSCRAAVRAKTSATAATLHGDPQRRTELEELARDYLMMAGTLLQPPAPCLVAVGGVSGTGKSTLALALAPFVGAVPGAAVIRSDEIRKRLCGVDPLVRLGPEGYAPEVSRRMYAMVAERATMFARSVHAVIADAVFARHADREAIESAAAVAGVPFVGLWLDAPEPVLIRRAASRRRDPSDADAAVIRNQRSRYGANPVAPHRRVILRRAGPPECSRRAE